MRDGGRYVIAGHYTDVGPSTINAHRHINRKHLEIRGCWGSEPGHFLRALAMLERHAANVPWREIGGRTYPLTGLNEALADAEAMRITKAVVDPMDRVSFELRIPSLRARAPNPESIANETHKNRRHPRPGLQPAGHRCATCSTAASTSFRLNFSHGSHESHAGGLCDRPRGRRRRPAARWR